MRLLVACPHRLFLVDTADRSVKVVEDQAPEYYGISWTPDGQQLATIHSCIDNASLATLEDYVESERGYLRLGQRTGVQGLSQPHQILCTDEHIIITNTGRNCLTLVRQKDLFYRHIWLDDIRWDRKGRDNPCGLHLNSVYLHEDRLYALAHNYHRGSRVAELTWPGLSLVRWIDTHASQAHNLWKPTGGPLLTCDTMRGTIAEAESGRIVWRAEAANQLTRGLASDGQFIYVGMSQTSAREHRTASPGGIWLLDRHTWQQVDFLPLPAAGNVHEIRVVDAPDECHHGHILKAVPEVDAEATQRYQAEVERRLAERKGLGWSVAFGAPEFPGEEVQLVREDQLNLLLAEGVYFKDGVVSATIDAPLSREHRYTGLAARYKGPGDENMVCVLIEIVKSRTYVSLWENSDHQWRQLGQTRLGSLPIKLQMELIGPTCAVHADGKRLLQATTRVVSAGGAGIRGLTGNIRDFHALTRVKEGTLELVFPPQVPKRVA
jgi:hypothetical protein